MKGRNKVPPPPHPRSVFAGGALRAGPGRPGWAAFFVVFAWESEEKIRFTFVL